MKFLIFILLLSGCAYTYEKQQKELEKQDRDLICNWKKEHPSEIDKENDLKCSD